VEGFIFVRVSWRAKNSSKMKGVKCNTRDNKILDLLYANCREAYSLSSLPPLSCLDRNLQPVYKPKIKPTTRNVRKWTEKTSEEMRDWTLQVF